MHSAPSKDHPRLFQPAEIPALAKMWHASWHHAHATLAPAPLVKLRTLQEFTERLPDLRDTMRVIGPIGTPLGLCSIKADELSQMFIAPDAHGTGIAATLLADGEARIAALGHKKAWLGVAPGNQRAIGFYRREGWTGEKETHFDLDTSEGVFKIKGLLLYKALPANPPSRGHH